MPRVHINVHDVDEIEELEEQEDWELQLGLAPAEPRRELAGTDGRNRTRGERRFGGNEALDRKRADRRKSFARASRRI
ncbi:MAG TPA: hypothetical protein VFU22_01435 [Roseiflexaceae bacterium]|nr:hypothetical protein [Roseiflexaceae bacterium]